MTYGACSQPDLTYRVYRRDNEFFHIYGARGDPLAEVPAFQESPGSPHTDRR